jgi:glutamate/tyrosine decarboxylase-like PLP-dependent enzyme
MISFDSHPYVASHPVSDRWQFPDVPRLSRDARLGADRCQIFTDVRGIFTAASAAEVVAGRWALDLLDLPRESAVGFTTGATMANFTGLAAARHHVLAAAGWDVERDGLVGAPPVEVVVGAERHVTIDVALRYLGLGSGRLRVVPADDQGRMDPAALGEVLAAVEGPTIVCAQAGNVNTGAFDPLPAIIAAATARIARGLPMRPRGMPVSNSLRMASVR